MMKFLDLVLFWEKLCNESSNSIKLTAQLDLDKVLDSAGAHFDRASFELLKTRYQNVLESFDLFEQELDLIKQQVQDQIAAEETAWFQRSYQWYERTLRERLSQHAEFPQQLRNQPVPLNPDAEKIFSARLRRYADWHHAAMIIHPGNELFIDYLVANDPLYLIDESHELLQPVVDRFEETYQRRLRCYVIEESLDQELLEKIPDGQFGLCFAYNYLNFRPIEMIKKYLAEIYEKLKPGGVFVMTFNDCERVAGVKLVEQNYACYTPAGLVRNLAQHLDFEIEFFWHDNGPSSWLELRKPGTLTSLRGGQTLAKIIPKPVANSK
jgi:SAM-dependent methyltransferase